MPWQDTWQPLTAGVLSAGAWYGILAVVSQLSVVTNALLIAITSNFVGFEVYIRGDYDLEYDPFDVMGQRIIPQNDDRADQGLSGYANWSQSVFEVVDLVDGSAFPAYTAQSLQLFNDDGTEARIVSGSTSEVPLYLPYINIGCVGAMIPNCTNGNLLTVNVSHYDGSVETVMTFSESGYERFYGSSKCRDLVLGTGRNRSPKNGSEGLCFNANFTCR